MYEFQDDLVERLVATARDSARHSPKCGSRVCLVLPTGAGKTVVAARVAKRLGGRILFVAHRRELIDQAVTRLVAAGVPAEEIGVMRGDDERTAPDARVQVASIQTFVRRRWSGPAPTTIVVDEAHHATSKSYGKVFEAFPAAFVLGLTATPVRLDGMGLAEVFEALEVGPSISNLVAQNVISAPRYFSAPDATLPDMRTAKRQAGDFRSSDAAGIMVPLHGAIVPEYLKRLVGIPTLCFAVNVDHAETIARAFEAAAIRAAVVTHETKPRDRAKAIKDLEAGRIAVIINVDVFGEGTDMPFVRGVILARPTLSETVWRQQVGRAMRPHAGEKVIVHDHVGACWLFGHPGWDRPWSLTETVERKPGTGAMRSCPSCGEGPFSVACATCPECGEELREMADRRLAAEGRKVSLVEMVAEAKAAGKLGEGVTTRAVVLRLRRGWALVDALSVTPGDARSARDEKLRQFARSPPEVARRAEMTRRRMQDPEVRAKVLAGTQTYHARTKRAAAMRAHMQDPEVRARQLKALHGSQAKEAANAAKRRPEAREKAAAAQRTYMESPEARAKIATANRKRMESPEERAAARARLHTPEVQAKRTAAMRRNAAAKRAAKAAEAEAAVALEEETT